MKRILLIMLVDACGDNSTPPVTACCIKPLPPQVPIGLLDASVDASLIQRCKDLMCLSVSCDNGFCECELGTNNYVVCSYADGL